MANKKKIATSAVAVATAAALALGGTFAWQSINQTALNEASDIVNPGGRLHNDMWYVSEKENNNDIYVENFAEDEIFARVRLGEFFEIVLNEGTAGEKLVPMIGEKELIQQTDENGDLVYDDGGNPVYTDEYKYTYVTFTGYDSIGKFDAGDNGDGTAYWTWKTGGYTTFMPTFNKNKDSLAPDLRGLYVDRIGGISNRANTQYTDAYGDMIDGVPTGEKEASAIYDYDSNMADELIDLDAVALTKLIDGDTNITYDTNAVTLKTETHRTKDTGRAQLISMSDWLSMIPYNDETGEYEYNPNHWSDEEKPGHAGYWVYDSDGWVYWSAPIAAGEATGLLLDGIVLKQVMDDTWYYAINVDAQFVTAGDMGTAPVYSDTEVDEDGNPVLLTPGTGFYANGETVQDDALTLLELIGVNDTTSDSTGDGTTDGGGDAGTISSVTVEGDLYENALYLAPGETTNCSIESETLTASDVTWSVADADGSIGNFVIDPTAASNNKAAVLSHTCADAASCSCGNGPYYVSVTVDETGETVMCDTPIYPYAYVELPYIYIGVVDNDASTASVDDYLIYGGTRQLYAYYNDDAGSTVKLNVENWMLSYDFAEGTSITDEGVLTISEDETESIIVVKATVSDGVFAGRTVYGSIAVTTPWLNIIEIDENGNEITIDSRVLPGETKYYKVDNAGIYGLSNDDGSRPAYTGYEIDNSQLSWSVSVDPTFTMATPTYETEYMDTGVFKVTHTCADEDSCSCAHPLTIAVSTEKWGANGFTGIWLNDAEPVNTMTLYVNYYDDEELTRVDKLCQRDESGVCNIEIPVSSTDKWISFNCGEAATGILLWYNESGELLNDTAVPGVSYFTANGFTLDSEAKLGTLTLIGKYNSANDTGLSGDVSINLNFTFNWPEE